MRRWNDCSKRSASLALISSFEDILPEVAGVYPSIMMEGEMDKGAWSCGMVAGLINDIPTCQELIDGIMEEAEAILGRMNAMTAEKVPA